MTACISTTVAPFHACNMSNCSPQRVINFIPLHHVHLSSSWCLNHHCKSAIWCCLLSVNRTCSFVIFAMFDVCILWGWCLHAFWTITCHIYIGAYHVFFWSMWWLAQACKLGLMMFCDFSPCSAVILMPCKLDATERSKHILRYFSKDVLNIWLFYIYSCPCLQLWSSLACDFRALLLLQNVLADCLHVIQFCQRCCSWSLHAMNLFLPWFVS